jgi:hypothetical protein
MLYNASASRLCVLLLLLLLQSRYHLNFERAACSSEAVSFAYAAAVDSESELTSSGGVVKDAIGHAFSADSSNSSSSSSIILTNSRLSGLPPVFVLNLDRSHQRWQNTQEQLLRAGLEVQRLSAVDGRLMSREELLKVSTRMALFLQPRGVIGCYLSHRRFWQMVVDRKMDYAVILEDDVKLVDGFKEKVYDC